MDTFLLLLAPALAATINAGTPLMLAAFGLLVNEKAGVLNLGAEGMMLLAAIAGFAMTIATGHKAGLDVAVCGEMAGDVKLTRLLLGMGLREFSMHPAQLLSVKQEILNSDLTMLVPRTRKILRLMEADAINEAVEQLRTA